jgi:N6-adenosine-specific RNA methylase IME4
MGAAGTYRTIVADPPWPYDDAGGRLGSSLMHRPHSGGRTTRHVGSAMRYGSMSIPNLCGLRPPADDDAHLYLWTTNAFVVEAHEIARAWGFAPKTLCTWGKVKSDGTPSMKTGHYFRGATEHVVFCVRGRLPFPTDVPTPTLWLWPRLAHSEKPAAFYDLVETVSPGPYLELFARRQRLGWDTWGHEALPHVDMASIARAALDGEKT